MAVYTDKVTDPKEIIVEPTSETQVVGQSGSAFSLMNNIDEDLDGFLNMQWTLNHDIDAIPSTAITEFNLLSDKLSLEFQPRILSMLDFVPCYDKDGSTYTETAAQNLINTKREVLKTTLDEIRADTDVFYDGMSARGPRTRKPFQSNIEELKDSDTTWSEIFDSLDGDESATIYDAEENFELKMFKAYKELLARYSFIEEIETKTSSWFEKYKDISGSAVKGYYNANWELNYYAYIAGIDIFATESMSEDGFGALVEINEYYTNLYAQDLSEDLQPSYILKKSLRLILDNFCDHGAFFNYPGANHDFFNSMLVLRGRPINNYIRMDNYNGYDLSRLLDTEIYSLEEWFPYMAVYDSDFDDQWPEKLAAMMFTLSERSIVLQRNPKYDETLINEIEKIVSIISDGPDTENEETKKYNFLHSDGLFDAIMSISSEDYDIVISDMAHIKDYYRDLKESIDDVINRALKGRNVRDMEFKAEVNDFGEFFNKIEDMELESLGGSTMGYSLLSGVRAWTNNRKNGFNKVYKSIMNGTTNSVSNMIIDKNKQIAKELIKTFCFPGLAEADYPEVDQEFMFLVCAISDIFAKKFTYAEDHDPGYNLIAIRPIFEKYVQEKFKLYRACNALNSVKIKINGARDSLDSVTSAAAYQSFAAMNSPESAIDRRLYTKRSINNKVKVWYESVQNYSQPSSDRIILEKHNLNEEFKNKGLELFMKKNKHIMDPYEVSERTKKILSIGFPTGLIDELERQGLYEESRNPYIKIRVHKRNFLDDTIEYEPRTFYFRLSEDIVFNNFKSYVFNGTAAINSGEGYTQISNRRSFDDSCTTYNQFIQKNTSILDLSSDVYDSNLWWGSPIDSLDDIDTDTQNFEFIKRNLNSKLYQYYIQSLYGIEISPESFLDDQELSRAQDYSIYLSSLDKPDLFKNILEQKSVMFNSTNIYNEITKKQLFDKIFHVLIDTENDFVPKSTSSDKVAALNDIDVKYDDFYVTIDIKKEVVEEESDADVFVHDNDDIEPPEDTPEEDYPLSVTVVINDILASLSDIQFDLDKIFQDPAVDAAIQDMIKIGAIRTQDEIEQLLDSLPQTPADFIMDFVRGQGNGTIWETPGDYFDNTPLLVSQIFTHDNIADMLNIASNHGINSSDVLTAIQNMVVDYRSSVLDTQNILNNAAADGTDGINMTEAIGIITNQYNTAKYYGEF
jgi:hypothetical protein